MDNSLDFSEFITEVVCRTCGRLTTDFIIPFDKRGFLCTSQQDCLATLAGSAGVR